MRTNTTHSANMIPNANDAPAGTLEGLSLPRSSTSSHSLFQRSDRRGDRWPAIAGLLALFVANESLRAAPIDVPNASFELPATVFVDTHVDSWQKSAQPAWFDPATAGIGWDQLSGVFVNTAPGTATHI